MLRLTCLLLGSLVLRAADLTGDWSLHVQRLGGEADAARLTLQADGSTVTGRLNELIIRGTIEGGHLQLKAQRDGKDWGQFDGKLQGDECRGTVKQGSEEFPFTARRMAAISKAAQVHTFEPTRFERVFSGAIAPVLHIAPGDSVKTTTVDAGGYDAKNKHRSLGGNPETGPFFVEGAMPGDTLAIKIVHLQLNRDSAMSGDRIVPSNIEPDYYKDAKYDENFDSNWKLDLQTGTGALAKPTAGLKNFKVQLQPMLGCVGVAPPASQSFRAGWLGSWGGNMDFHGVREGTTVYLPVYREGALLFVGDGHALEGDGELNGDALETSMAVEFQVNLMKGQNTRGPRFEDSEYLMASGIAGSLSDALQSATTELARWLEKDYKLTANESNVVLGTSIQYEVAEVVDPQVHIVAKVKKSVLASLR